MNNVIEQLKSQATEDIMGVPVLNAEMFAVLIVRECAKVANDDYNIGFCPVGDFIKEHFGVE